MPETRVISKKKVILKNDNIKLVLEAFQEALLKNNASESFLLPDEYRTRKGLWGIVEKIEKLTSTLLGATETVLPKLEFEFDYPAARLLEGYENFLNKLFKADDVKSDEIASNTINNHLVLIREFLIRIAADALSTNMNNLHQGSLLLKIMEDFIDSLLENEQLIVSGFLFKTINKYARSLLSSHEDWLDTMAKVIEGIELLYKNKTVVTSALNALSQLSKTISRQILAELATTPNIKDGIKSARFDDSIIYSSVELLENLLFKKSKDILKGEQFKNKVEKVIHCIPQNLASGLKNEVSKRENLKRLYKLLAYNESISLAMGQIDSLNSAIGWVAIITGALDLKNFSSVFKNHAANCTTVLAVSDDMSIFNEVNGISKGLIIYKATSIRKLRNLAFKTADELEYLGNKEIASKIIKFVKSSLQNLVELEKTFNIKLVNIEKTKHLTDSLESGPNIPLTNQSQIKGISFFTSDSKSDFSDFSASLAQEISKELGKTPNNNIKQ